MTTGPDHTTVSDSVKRVVIAESRLSLAPEEIQDNEPLSGDLLRINSMGFVGMLVQLEDTLDVTLPDDLFVGRTFKTVNDLVEVVAEGARETEVQR
ncbi:MULTISPECIES: acyl carrier protein [unclassified Amycolatopsis]|uniref:acyl carrier protein n=1 Tax=unclassified Amycolatopsis TaxID=2618356 RepID=UPI001FF53AAF|nr:MULTISPECIES: acyl carrier protein [unclassified Amycolatopsis]UOZ05371.1 acyl carrier protein [Amycolatopsis sp. WQ 127309]WSJ80951.1 acyl carrier protein [Amycolatopsis sp. NBC_01307]WSK75611.1 acyl carrier protein [Amycolatopsis sp. NBC_01286]